MLIFGTTINGARRWVNFFVFTFQPADVAKVALIIYLAKVLEEGQLDTFKKVFTKLVAPVGIICALIIIVDTSTSVLIGTCCLCVMFIGGVKTKYILNTIGIALISLAFIYLIDIQFFGGKTRINTVISRVLVFSDKDRAKENPDAIIQPNHAKAAVASGGIIGKGPGNSTQRHVLEEAYSDYIYAIIVEEYGLIGGMTILMAYLWLLFRAVMIAKKCSRIFPIILVLGLSLMIVLQAVIHMGVSVGVLPVTGLNLPLVSHGGTSIVFTCLALGIILAVSRTADNQELSLEGLEQDEAVEPQKLKA
jgi:cell division protein FtsW